MPVSCGTQWKEKGMKYAEPVCTKNMADLVEHNRFKSCLPMTAFGRVHSWACSTGSVLGTHILRRVAWLSLTGPFAEGEDTSDQDDMAQRDSFCGRKLLLVQLTHRQQTHSKKWGSTHLVFPLPRAPLCYCRRSPQPPTVCSPLGPM